jgi:ribonucleoside-diphosphate reductase alpha chain
MSVKKPATYQLGKVMVLQEKLLIKKSHVVAYYFISVREIVRQLSGIGGRSLGLGPNRVRSLPDGIGQVLDMYLREKSGALPVIEDKRSSPEGKTNGNGGSPLASHKIEEEAAAQMEIASPKMKIGDLCPECGEAAVVNEEGCRKCYACGYSEC